MTKFIKRLEILMIGMKNMDNIVIGIQTQHNWLVGIKYYKNSTEITLLIYELVVACLYTRL